MGKRKGKGRGVSVVLVVLVVSGGSRGSWGWRERDECLSMTKALSGWWPSLNPIQAPRRHPRRFGPWSRYLVLGVGFYGERGTVAIPGPVSASTAAMDDHLEVQDHAGSPCRCLDTVALHVCTSGRRRLAFDLNMLALSCVSICTTSSRSQSHISL